MPAIQSTERPHANNIWWRMVKLPLFEAQASAEVVTETEARKAASPGCTVKPVGHDRLQHGQVLCFVAYIPDRPTG